MKECKHCHKKSLNVEYLGTNPDTNDKIFSVVCENGCTDYMYLYNKDTKFYVRTGNLNQKVNQ